MGGGTPRWGVLKQLALHRSTGEHQPGRKGDHEGSGMVTDGVLVLELAGCGPSMNVGFCVVHLCSKYHTHKRFVENNSGR